MSVIANSHHRFVLLCFDGSGCSAPFSETEIKKFLHPKTFQALDNLRTNHEIKEVAFKVFVFCS
jgi:hypothetical protein